MDEIEDLIMQDFSPKKEEVKPEVPVEVKEPVSVEQPKKEEVEPSSKPEDSKADGLEDGKSPAKPVASEEEKELDWDSFIESPKPSEQEAKPQIDFSTLGEALGFGALKSQEELVQKVKELQSSKSEVDTSVPEDLAEAIKIAKSNGDYRAYLGIASVDYKNADPIELFEDEAVALFEDGKGNFDEDAYYDYIDSISDIDKKMRGNQLKRELIHIQEQQKETIRQRALVKKQEELHSLQTELNKITEIAGFPVKDTIKKQIFEDFATGKYKEELGLIGKNGANQDYKKSIENYFKAKYFDAFTKFYGHKIKTATKRQIHDELSNSTISSQPTIESPVGQPKQVSGVDLYLKEMIDKLGN